MNPSSTLLQPKNGLDDLLALIGLPSKRRSAGELPNGVEEILRGTLSFIDGLLLQAVTAQTEAEFVSVRAEVFPQYLNIIRLLARLVRNLAPDAVIERALGESFCELEAEFRDHGISRFGVPTKEQAMFTIWTLRRTSRLISKIASSGKVPEHLKEQDREIASNYSYHALFAQFHLDCLLFAIRNNKPIQLDVLPVMTDGLRAAVDAYGYARQGLNMRDPKEEPLIAAYEWDEEDQELLDSSMREMESVAVEGADWEPILVHTSADEHSVQAEVAVADGPPAFRERTLDTISQKDSSSFGTHIREGIEIVKDWIESRKHQREI
jgi:hypothetical protein